MLVRPSKENEGGTGMRWWQQGGYDGGGEEMRRTGQPAMARYRGRRDTATRGLLGSSRASGEEDVEAAARRRMWRQGGGDDCSLGRAARVGGAMHEWHEGHGVGVGVGAGGSLDPRVAARLVDANRRQGLCAEDLNVATDPGRRRPTPPSPPPWLPPGGGAAGGGTGGGGEEAVREEAAWEAEVREEAKVEGCGFRVWVAGGGAGGAREAEGRRGIARSRSIAEEN
ncbi:unnamed protein product [Urochloa humidicola]